MFISLYVIHNPDEFGLRASWAAGVRSRLSPETRKVLEAANHFLPLPFHLVHSLQEPKDAAAAIYALRRIPPAERLPFLTLAKDTPAEAQEIVDQVSAKGSWDEQDVEALRGVYRKREKEPLPVKMITAALDAWKDRPAFGEQYLNALQAYYDAFFKEEERHLPASLQQGLLRAQDLARKLSLGDLLGELSQGVHIRDLDKWQKVLLVPSYWATPLIFMGKIGDDMRVITFGVRPPGASLVPGEQVPEAILGSLKALSDPTRLRILRYLAAERLSPAELARRLRLRAPTMTHHLSALRLAGLVHVNVESNHERLYSARLEAIEALFSSLKEFLENPIDENE